MTRKDKFLMRMYNANLYLRREDNVNFLTNMILVENEIGDIPDFVNELSEKELALSARNFRIFLALKREINSLPVDYE